MWGRYKKISTDVSGKKMTGPKVLGCLGRIRHLQLVNACGKGSGVWSYFQSKHIGAAVPCQHQNYTSSSVTGLHQECHSPKWLPFTPRNTHQSLSEAELFDPLLLSLSRGCILWEGHGNSDAEWWGWGNLFSVVYIFFTYLFFFHALEAHVPYVCCSRLLSLLLCLTFKLMDSIGGRREKVHSILTHEWVAMPHCQELVSLYVRIVSVRSSKPN